MKKHYRKETDCLNCGADLQGHFCHVCGQENLEMKESFGHMATHAISDYFHFDYQFFHTLRPLLLKPGKLSVDYMAGRRMQYLHPIKMYIFISLLFFVLVFQNNKNDVDPDPKPKKEAASKMKSEFNKNIDKDASLSAEQKAKLKNGFTAAGVDIGEDDSVKINVKDNDTGGEMTLFGISADKNDTYDKYIVRQNKLPVSKRDNFLERYVKKKTYEWQGKKDAQEIFTENFKHNVPKMMFILLPLCALILKVAFWSNHKFYVEHLIYTIHLHCYLFLTFIVLMILHLTLPKNLKTINDVADMAVFFYVVWYLYKSLKVVYQRSSFRTITKMIGVSMMYFLSLGLCFMVIIALTAILTT